MLAWLFDEELQTVKLRAIFGRRLVSIVFPLMLSVIMIQVVSTSEDKGETHVCPACDAA